MRSTKAGNGSNLPHLPRFRINEAPQQLVPEGFGYDMPAMLVGGHALPFFLRSAIMASNLATRSGASAANLLRVPIWAFHEARRFSRASMESGPRPFILWMPV